MSDEECIGIRSVVPHQRPAREALFDMVKTNAQGSLCLLSHQHVEVTTKQAPQHGLR